MGLAPPMPCSDTSASKDLLCVQGTYPFHAVHAIHAVHQRPRLLTPSRPLDGSWGGARWVREQDRRACRQTHLGVSGIRRGVGALEGGCEDKG